MPGARTSITLRPGSRTSPLRPGELAQLRQQPGVRRVRVGEPPGVHGVREALVLDAGVGGVRRAQRARQVAQERREAGGRAGARRSVGASRLQRSLPYCPKR